MNSENLITQKNINTSNNTYADLSETLAGCKRLLVLVTLLAVDYGAVILAILTTYILQTQIMPDLLLVENTRSIIDVYACAYLVIPLAVIFFISFDNLYIRRMPSWQQSEKLFKVTVYSLLFVLGLLYFFELNEYFSGIVIPILGVFIFLYVSLGRSFARKILLAANLWQIPVILIGTEQMAERLVNSFRQDNALGYKIIGLIEDNIEKADKVFQGIPIIGSLATTEETVKRTGVKNVLLATHGLSGEYLANIAYKLQPYTRNIIFIPDISGLSIGTLKPEMLFAENLVLLKIKNNLARASNRILKFLFDIVLTVCGGILILPFLLIVAIIIYFDSPGNIIFAHKRVGRNGKMFNCYKFRTMSVNAQEILKDYLEKNPSAREEWEKDFKLKDDPRITRAGKFLRRASIDEFPQLLNVLKGEMSLVGPRPIVKDEVSRYGQVINDYYLVRPGITGFWQVSGRSDVDYENRVQMDLWYVRNWSLWLDIMILFKTIKVVFQGKGSY